MPGVARAMAGREELREFKIVFFAFIPNIPLFQHSIIPRTLEKTDIARKPFKFNRLQNFQGVIYKYPPDVLFQKE